MAKKLKFYIKKGNTVLTLTEDRFPFIWNWLAGNLDRISDDYTELQKNNKLAKYGMVMNGHIPTYLLGEKGWQEVMTDLGVKQDKISISYGAPNKVFCYLKPKEK